MTTVDTALDLTFPEMLDATGISIRQLDHWTRRGLLRTTGQQRPGSGQVRSWPPAEVEVATRMRRLVAAGLTPPAAERAARGHALAPGVIVLMLAEVA